MREKMKEYQIEEEKKEAVQLYFCGWQKTEPGHAFGPAVRPHYLIHFILRGKGSYEAGGKTYLLSAGDAFLIYPGETTYYKADEKDPWEYVWIGMGGEETELILGECDFWDGYVYSGKGQESILEYVRKIADLFASYQKNRLEIMGYFYLLFSEMKKRERKERSDAKEEYILKAEEYIRHNYSYPITVQGIADYIGIDRSYFYRLMREEKKISPQQYIIRYRIFEAERLLRETGLPVTQIAFSCGFKDTPSFCRMFKEKTGESPLVYRKRQALLEKN